MPFLKRLKSFLFHAALAGAVVAGSGRALVQAGRDPATQAGVSWLLAEQTADGNWSPGSPVTFRDTAEALVTLLQLSETGAVFDQGMTWVATTTVYSVDYIGRKVLLHRQSGADAAPGAALLRVHQNADGGWGLAPGHGSDVFDTALVLEAIVSGGASGSEKGLAVGFLLSAQNADGGWGLTPGSDSAVVATALAMRALWPERGAHPGVASALAGAQSHLLSRRGADGLWNEPFESALAFLALLPAAQEPSALAVGINALRAAQGANGSWNDDVYATALVLRVLDLFQNPPPSPAEVRGVVTSGHTGLPLSGVSIVLTGATSAAAMTDEEGRYRVEPLQPALTTIKVSLDGYDVVTANVSVTPSTSVVFSPALFLLNTSPPEANTTGVRGVVIDADGGRPLADVIVHARVGAVGRVVATGSDGGFEVTGLPAGPGWLTLDLNGYVSRVLPLDLPPLASLDAGRILLVPESAGAALPDLLVSSVSYDAVRQDLQTLIVSGRVGARARNIGGAGAPAGVRALAFYDADGDEQFNSGVDVPLGESVAARSLEAGGTMDLEIPVQGTLPFRDASISIYMDSAQAVAERNESNNVNRGATVCPVDRPAPDLTASLLRVTDLGAEQGVRLSLRIGNAGAVPLVSSEASFYGGDPAAGGVFLGRASAGGIRANGFQDAVFVSTAPFPDVQAVHAVVSGRTERPIPASLSEWTGHEQVGSPGVPGAYASRPDAGIILNNFDVNAAGAMAAAWCEPGGDGRIRVYASRRDPGGEVERVLLRTTQGAEEPSAVIDGAGNILIAWRDLDDPADQRIWTSEYKAGQEWGEARPLPGGPGGRLNELFAVGNARGDMMLTWHAFINRSVWAAYRPAGGTLGAAELVAVHGIPLSNPRTAIDAGGNAVTVWEGGNPGRYANIHAARYVAGEGWRPAEQIETNNSWHSTQPQIALRDDGDGLATWIEGDPAGVYSVWIASFTAGQWGPPVRSWTPAEGQYYQPAFAWDKEGNGLMVWYQDINGPALLWTARYDRSSGWRPAAPIQASGGIDDARFRIAFDDHGDAMLVWAEGPGDARRLWSLYYSAVNGWEAAKKVQDLNLVGYHGDFGFDALGNVYMVWGEYAARRVGSETMRFAKRTASSLSDECRLDNNASWTSVFGNLNGDVSVAPDKAVYGPHSPAVIAVTVTNTSSLPGVFQASMRIEDSNGVEVSAFPTREIGPLRAGNEVSFTEDWNTGFILAGAYRLRGSLRDAAGKLLSEEVSTFSIGTNDPVCGDLPSADNCAAAVTASVMTDKSLYGPLDTARITERVDNSTLNRILSDSNVQTVLSDAGGMALWSRSETLPQLVQGSERGFSYAVPLNSISPGAYTVSLTVQDPGGSRLAYSTTTFTVRSSADTGSGLKGAISVSPERVPQGDALSVVASFENTGNAPFVDLPVTISIIDPAGQGVIAAFADTLSLARGERFVWGAEWKAAGPVGATYVAVLSATLNGRAMTLAQDSFNIVEPSIRLQSSLAIGAKGRLLVLVDGPRCGPDGKQCDDDPHGPGLAPGLSAQREALEALLKETGWSAAIVDTAEAFTRAFRAGGYAAYALFAEREKLDKNIQKELREAVFRGEGLLVAGMHDDRHHELLEVLGVKLIGNVSRAVSVRFTESPLGMDGTMRLLPDDKALRIERLAGQSGGSYLLRGCDDAPEGHLDALTLNHYGRGRSVFVGVDLLVMATLDGRNSPAARLLLKALNHVHPETLRARAGNVVPLTLTLENQGAPFRAKATLILPPGVTVIDAADAEGWSDTWFWEIPLDGQERKDLTLWVRLPEDSGPLLFKSRVEALQDGHVRLVAESDLSLPLDPLPEAEAIIALLEALIKEGAPESKDLRKAQEYLRISLSHIQSDPDKALREALQVSDLLNNFASPQLLLIRLEVSRWIGQVERAFPPQSPVSHR
jgi:hypothetical protein